MPEFLYTNFGRTTLAADVAAGATTMTVQFNDANKFPSPDNTYDEVFSCILFTPDQTEIEVVYCTARVENGFTVERGKEGTTDRAWPEGTLLIHNMTAQIFTDIVAAGPRDIDVVVGVADSGAGTAGIYSTDGLVYTGETTPLITGWESVIFSESLGLFVAVSESGTAQSRVMTSPDGENWTIRTSPNPDKPWESVAWSPTAGAFIAVGGFNLLNAMMRSTDGISWSLVDPTGSSDNTSPNEVRYFPAPLNKFCVTGTTVFGGNQDYWDSSDGLTWTFRAVDVGNGLCLAYAPALTAQGTLVMCGDTGGGQIRTSTDLGVSWSGPTSPGFVLLSIDWSPTLSIFASLDGSGNLRTSTDGTSWTLRDTLGGINEEIRWMPEFSLFVAVGSGAANRIATSPDGITWTARTEPQAVSYRSITQGKGPPPP